MHIMRFVHVQPTEGMGNRFRAMACGYALSKHFQCPFHITWNAANDCKLSWHSLVQKNSPLDAYHVAPSELPTMYPGCTPFMRMGVHTSAVLSDPASTEGCDSIVIQGGHDFKHPDMDVANLLAHKHAFYRMLIASLPAPVIRAAQDVLRSVGHAPMVGVHLRGFVGKYDTADGYDFENSTMLDIAVSMANKAVATYPSGCVVFVSTNSDKFRSAFESRVACQCVSSSYHGNGRDTEQDVVAAVVDMYLLSLCQEIVGTYRSSFSDEAAIMGGVTKTMCSNNTRSEYHAYGLVVHADGTMKLNSSASRIKQTDACPP